MPGCPGVPSGVYQRQTTDCGLDEREIWLDGHGAFDEDPGCYVEAEFLSPATCQAGVQLVCPARTYTGRLDITGPGAFRFVGSVGGCPVTATFTRAR